MLAWHLAAVTFLFRWIFRDPKVDMRFLAVGVVLPDVVDLTVVTLMGGTIGEIWSHTLLVPSLVGVVILLTTRRGRHRRAWMALVVAWLLHLLVDGMWTHTEIFLWPAFGWDLAQGSGSLWTAAWQRATTDPWRWILEAVGIGYLIWLIRTSRLADASHRRRLIETGRLPSSPTNG